jgi:hypothetical protein
MSHRKKMLDYDAGEPIITNPGVQFGALYFSVMVN